MKLGLLFLVLASWATYADTKVMMKLKSCVSMHDLAAQVTDPRSAKFNHFLTPGQIRELAAPNDAEYEEFVLSLQRQGFHHIQETQTHLWVTAQGNVTTIQRFMAGQFSQSGLVQLAQPWSHVEHVIGTQPSGARHPHRLAGKLVAGPFDGTSPSQIREAYDLDYLYKQNLAGHGQHIAIATYDDFDLNNTLQYFQDLGLTTPPRVDSVQFNGVPKKNDDSAAESDLDVEMAGLTAPGSAIHVFSSSTNDDTGEAQMFTAILDDNRAKAVNYSWGECEDTVNAAHKQAMNEIFARAVAQGVNIFVASGDDGSDSCRTGKPSGDWPSVSPYIVAVGGTSVTVSSHTVTESAWTGSGGGISNDAALPIWQNQLGAPFVRRSFPDVAFNADPQTGQAVLSGGDKASYYIVGGTSMAAPQWAGIMSLLNEARVKNNQQSLGFLNPLLYAMKPSDRAGSFRDVTSGSNGGYSAVIGWDAVTGWGTPQGHALLNWASSQP